MKKLGQLLTNLRVAFANAISPAEAVPSKTVPPQFDIEEHDPEFKDIRSLVSQHAVFGSLEAEADYNQSPYEYPHRKSLRVNINIITLTADKMENGLWRMTAKRDADIAFHQTQRAFGGGIPGGATDISDYATSFEGFRACRTGFDGQELPPRGESKPFNAAALLEGAFAGHVLRKCDLTTEQMFATFEAVDNALTLQGGRTLYDIDGGHKPEILHFIDGRHIYRNEQAEKKRHPQLGLNFEAA